MPASRNNAQNACGLNIDSSSPWIDFIGLQEKVGYEFNCKLLVGYRLYD